MARTIDKVGVIGAGQMGHGIAQVCAASGFQVLLNDVSEERIEAGLATIQGNMARQIAKQIMTEDQCKQALGRIAIARRLDDLSECDLVIETAAEVEEIKRDIFAALCPVLNPDAIVGSNTSSISITRLAATTDRPEQFIGLHFMNPVPLMELASNMPDSWRRKASIYCC